MNNVKKLEEIYISVDVEADGSIPGMYSMTALGAAVSGYRTKDGEVVELDVTAPENKFYVQLKPISDEWEPEAIRVGLIVGFDNTLDDPDGLLRHRYLAEHGEEPEAAMEAFTAWVRERTVAYNASVPVFVGFPVVYDWMWVYWYMIAFTKDGSPFGHGRAADIKTAYAVRSGQSIRASVKSRMPRFLMSKLPHTHKADDDAAEQGQLFTNILKWVKK